MNFRVVFGYAFTRMLPDLWQAAKTPRLGVLFIWANLFVGWIYVAGSGINAIQSRVGGIGGIALSALFLLYVTYIALGLLIMMFNGIQSGEEAADLRDREHLRHH